jgi:chromosome segregation protein
MQLKKLEMCGFKSFANRTEIVFNRGVTGIVGPNGCGKSNVVDAIKWVLGTLSYKSVRGEEMLDVIFKGAQGVAAMGFAEVSLTLDNSDHTLPLEFEEVTITRRLFNTGEGEYYINKAPCRLKDIRDLLYGTGIGTDNYSVIEQGKIDKLVLSNPHERRLVFDEAAGISKYRAKKRETENRLEKVSQDLLRIQDVVTEVSKQLRSVRAQAGRAAAWRRLQEEWKQRRQKLLVHEHRALEARGAEIAERLRALGEEEARLRAELEARTAACREAEQRVREESARQSELASALASLESQDGYLAHSAQQAEARGRELEGEIQGIEAERAGQDARARELDQRVEEESCQRAELEAQALARAAEAEDLRLRVEEAGRECARAAAELEDRKAEAMELAHQEAQYRNERDRLEKDHADLTARIAASRERCAKLETDLSEIRARISAAAEARAAMQGEIDDFKARLKVEEAEKARLREERERLESDLVHLREGKDHRVARQETLRDLELQFEGLESGARELLRERPAGVLGTVADFLEVAPEHVAAVEGALGEWAGAVVCGTDEQAQQAADWVRARGLGRTVLVSLDECRAEALPEDELATGGLLARADRWVAAEEPYRGMAQALLGRTFVAQDASTAQFIRRSRLIDQAMVTPEGDFFGGPGMLVTAGAKAAPGLISRKAELRRLEDEIGQYMSLIEDRDRRRTEADRRLEVADEKLECIRVKIYELTVTLSDMVKETDQDSMREHFMSGEQEALSGEIEANGRQAEAVAERSRSLESLLAQLAWLKSQVGAEISALGETQKKYESSRDGIKTALEHARLEVVKANEQRAAIGKRLEMLAASRAEVSQALERLDTRRAETAARREAAQEDGRRLAGQREELGRRVAEAREHAAESARKREELEAASREAQAGVDGVEAGLGPCVEESGRLRTEEAVHHEKVESLARRGREELETDLATAAAAAPPDEAADWEAEAREVEEMRARIAGFGAVNVDALNQLQELEEREKFMGSQKEDLERSKGQLEDLIRQLNKESRELFDKTIEFVREQFNTAFRKIFGGGKADIIVEQADGVDPMEQGLEIMARPPSKELTSISLLSGGERSLTAIALVMALFKANPSPFCLLDEADAALDEKNVGRYAGLIHEYASETQFIVITHNKRTMSVCDALYGVTMEQPGVSKRVSVSLSGDGNLDLMKTRTTAATSGTPAVEPAPEVAAPVLAGAPA